MKSTSIKNILFILCFLALSACASLKSVSITRVPQDRSNPISSEAWGWGFLGIYFDNDFANEAVKKLDSQCENGRISGVMTKYTSKFYLLWTTRTINATGYCLAERAK
ncbi:MAG: hypothetical protein KGP28_11555 [Bdellovibrionales bacterium]|nr:hypothetical protein [Bdellovibrionales bacterium]